MAMNFKASAQKATVLSPLMENRTQVSTDELIKAYPEGFTINRFDIVTIDDNSFPVLTLVENEEVYFYGGAILNKICMEWVQDFGGDVTGCSEELEKSGGVKIKLEPTKTKKGNNLTNVTIL